MKLIKEFVIILVITFLGEAAKSCIDLPIPASIYGLIFMLIALSTGILKIEHVKTAGSFLIEIMPLMFIPAAVGIIVAWKDLSPICTEVVFIIVISTILVMGISGIVTQEVIKISERRGK